MLEFGLDFVVIGRLLIVAVGLIAGTIGLMAAVTRLKTARKKKALLESEFSDRFVKQFNDKELRRFLSGYIIPHCSPSDPANKEGEEYLADLRESIFTYMDRSIESASKSYHLLLADTGMGKTTFCLNYLAHARRCFPDLNIAIVSMAGKSFENHVRSIGNKSDTILIADAFDEDPKGWGRGRDRLSDFLEMAEDFRCVIMTCRSQYFLSDDTIPRETPLALLVPRSLNQTRNYSLIRSYISPFSPKEIDAYIDRHFPLLYFWRLGKRRRAKSLVESIPDLAHRPMLLERLPELARTTTKSREIFDLYETLVEGWLARESRWINEDRLRSVSLELAVHMYRDFATRRGRLKPDEIHHIAVSRIGDSPHWDHLTARSLLNRDSRGYFKFAHKSIMEFLVVKAACDGDDRAFSTEWTSFMKELFISWGHSEAGKGMWERAQEMLRSEQGRSNITPLYDSLDLVAVRGLPDFKRCGERRRTSTGARIAPASWRSSAIDVFNKEGRGVITVYDAEFALRWTYLPTKMEGLDYIPVRLLDALNFLDGKPQYRLPSYEQFICLVEGLYRVDREIIPDGKLFLVGDKRAKYEHLLVQINADVTESPHLHALDKQRRITGTSIYVNCYEAGLKISHSYATDIFVEQLYIEDSSEAQLPFQTDASG